MDAELIRRINELARKSRTPQGLTEEEKREQTELRSRYLAQFRQEFRRELESIVIEDPQGNRHKPVYRPKKGN